MRKRPTWKPFPDGDEWQVLTGGIFARIPFRVSDLLGYLTYIGNLSNFGRMFFLTPKTNFSIRHDRR